MKKHLIILAIMLSVLLTGGCMRTMFVWTMGDAFAIAVVIVYVLILFIIWIRDMIVNWINKNKKK